MVVKRQILTGVAFEIFMIMKNPDQFFNDKYLVESF